MVGIAILEGAMIFHSLFTTFVLVFTLIAAFGHVLLLQAMFAPKESSKQPPAQTDESRHAPVAAARVAA
jgi:hypothetical protein